jgi:two-component system, chemotaxis family, CheB/CheR fusion protein
VGAHRGGALSKKNSKKPKRKKTTNTAEHTKPNETSAASVSTVTNKTFPIVGVGASAGGLEALKQLLAAVPNKSGIAFVLVRHLPSKQESMLTELLSKTAKLAVLDVIDGMAVVPDHIYVIPPNADLSIEQGSLHLHSLAEGRSRHMPIDSFFRSLAEDQQSRAVGVILSGTASDGTLGLQAIKAQGGITFAQDGKTAKYSAMPRSAIAAGNVDFVLTPEQIVRELIRISRHMQLVTSQEGPGAEPRTGDENLFKIFSILRNTKRVDFAYYKQETIRRRITRRMLLKKIEKPDEYVRVLRKDPDEVENLFLDVLVNVTGFFRDPEAYEALKKTAFPSLMQNRSRNAPIRVWVPGCSTGEEAYSLAICLLEYLGDIGSSTQIQIFATDISENIIQRARAGIYPESIGMDVSPERLRRFFHKSDSGYQISKTIRDMCVFSKQDVSGDPPFSKLDLISCRNVMIYMGAPLEKRIIPTFHYALNPVGILFLGSSETVDSHSNLFAPVDKKYKIYSKKSLPVPLHLDFIPQFSMDNHEAARAAMEGHSHTAAVDVQKVADQILLNRYAPGSLVVTDSLDIVQFIGHTGPFLEPVPGEATLNLLKMVKAGLQLELRAAFQKVKREGIVRKEGLIVLHNGGLKSVNFEVIPLRNLPEGDRYYLVVFEDAAEPKSVPKSKGEKNKKPSGKKSGDPAADNLRLSEELDATREYLQSIIEEQRTTNEELRSANEEIQSSNEELQSINEELETAKEELQSTNEELTTVNEEVQNRNDELTQLNNDLNNLLSSVNIPIVMLGNDLRVRRFTPMAEKVMDLIATDIGRPITDIKPNLKLENLKDIITDVLDTLKIQDLQVEDSNGNWYSMRVRPYRTADNKIAGVVMVLVDVLHGEDARDEPSDRRTS